MKKFQNRNSRMYPILPISLKVIFKPFVFAFGLCLLSSLVNAESRLEITQNTAPQSPAIESTAAKMSVSLDEAVAIAVKTSPMALMARRDSDAAEARISMASSARKFSLSTTSFLTDGDKAGVIPGPASVMPQAFMSYPAYSFYGQNVMLMAPLDLSGKLKKNIAGASFLRDAAGYESEKARQDVSLDVRMAYYDALYMSENVKVYEAAADTAKQMLDNDTVAVGAGKIPAYYLERDKTELAMNQQMIANMEKDSLIARSRLAAAMGLDPSTKLELTSTLEPPDQTSAPSAFSPSAPELSAARTREKAASVSVDSAKKAFKPDVALTLMYDRMATRDDGVMNGTTAALVAAYPIRDGGMRKAAVREAESMRAAAAEGYRSGELKSRMDFVAARLEFDTALKNVATLEQAVKSADENLRVAKLRYDAGKSVLVEVLDAKATLTRVKVGRLQAVRDAVIARDTILRICGKL